MSARILKKGIRGRGLRVDYFFGNIIHNNVLVSVNQTYSSFGRRGLAYHGYKKNADQRKQRRTEKCFFCMGFLSRVNVCTRGCKCVYTTHFVFAEQPKMRLARRRDGCGWQVGKASFLVYCKRVSSFERRLKRLDIICTISAFDFQTGLRKTRNYLKLYHPT